MPHRCSEKYTIAPEIYLESQTSLLEIRIKIGIHRGQRCSSKMLPPVAVCASLLSFLPWSHGQFDPFNFQVRYQDIYKNPEPPSREDWDKIWAGNLVRNYSFIIQVFRFSSFLRRPQIRRGDPKARGENSLPIWLDSAAK